MAVMEAIETVYLEKNVSYVTLSGIPSTYEHLQVRGNMRSGNATAGIDMWMAVNGAGGYQYTHKMYFNATSGQGLATGANGYISFGDTTGTLFNDFPFFPTFVIDLHDYAATDKGKTVQYQFGKSVWSSESLGIGGGFWDDNAAITNLKFYFTSGEIQRGSVISLYGFNE